MGLGLVGGAVLVLYCSWKKVVVGTRKTCEILDVQGDVCRTLTMMAMSQ
jgi:hypothetical protein